MTRLSHFIFKQSLKTKTLYLENRSTGVLVLLLLGFLTGNLFSTVLNKIRVFIVWDALILAFLILFMETVSYARYTPLHRNVLLHQTKDKVMLFLKPSKSFINLANLFKIGLLIGFFVDAFKVGS